MSHRRIHFSREQAPHGGKLAGGPHGPKLLKRLFSAKAFNEEKKAPNKDRREKILLDTTAAHQKAVRTFLLTPFSPQETKDFRSIVVNRLRPIFHNVVIMDGNKRKMSVDALVKRLPSLHEVFAFLEQSRKRRTISGAEKLAIENIFVEAFVTMATMRDLRFQGLTPDVYHVHAKVAQALSEKGDDYYRSIVSPNPRMDDLSYIVRHIEASEWHAHHTIRKKKAIRHAESSQKVSEAKKRISHFEMSREKRNFIYKEARRLAEKGTINVSQWIETQGFEQGKKTIAEKLHAIGLNPKRVFELYKVDNPNGGATRLKVLTTILRDEKTKTGKWNAIFNALQAQGVKNPASIEIGYVEKTAKSRNSKKPIERQTPRELLRWIRAAAHSRKRPLPKRFESAVQLAIEKMARQGISATDKRVQEVIDLRYLVWLANNAGGNSILSKMHHGVRLPQEYDSVRTTTQKRLVKEGMIKIKGTYFTITAEKVRPYKLAG